MLAMTMAVMATLGATYRVEDIPNVHLADSTQFVSNPDGILSATAVNRLNALLHQVWMNTTAEPAVVVVDDIDTQDIDGFATDLFTKWGIGKDDKDNGVLLLVVKDRRGAVIRPGYGIEGILPDGKCGRILRNEMFPRFAEGDYDGGVEAGVTQIAQTLANPDNADELRSSQRNNAGAYEEDDSLGSWLLTWMGTFLIISLVFLAIIYAAYLKGKNSGDVQSAYKRLEAWRMPLLLLSFIGLGAPLVAYLPLRHMLNSLRNSGRKCPRCHHGMVKMDEDADNAYLNTAQDMEEKLNSVDYDVWVCPECNEVDIIPFDNARSQYTKCPKCGAKACHVVSMQRLVAPTTRSEGVGMKTILCEHCRNRFEQRYSIPREEDPAAAAAAGAILGSMLGRGGGFGGGGFGGGSFGGGSTGGGGASGHW